MRSILYAAKILENDDRGGYFKKILDNNRDYLTQHYIVEDAPRDNALHRLNEWHDWGTPYSHSIEDQDNPDKYYVAFAPWQVDYGNPVWNMATVLYPDDEQWKGIRDYFCQGAVDRVLQGDPTLGCLYLMKAHDTRDSTNFYQDYEKVKAETLKAFYPQAIGTKPGTAERMKAITGSDGYKDGDWYGYPKSPHGYAIWMRAGLCAAVDGGLPGADEALAKCLAQPTQPDFSHSAAWAILPRKKAA
jgi:hypothetical protein